MPAVLQLKTLVDENDDDIPVIVRILAKNLVEAASADKIIERSMPEIREKIGEITEKLRKKQEESGEK